VITLPTPQGLAPPTQVGGRGRAVLGGVLVATAGSQLRYSMDTNVQGFDLLPDDALRHTPTQILHQKLHTRVAGCRQQLVRPD
jgi:hypothetical protein